MTVFNYYQVTGNIASSGQPKEEEFKDISDQGYETVINLAMPDHDQSINHEGSIVTGLGMTYIHLPVPFDAPTKSHLDEFSGYMDALIDQKVWVHCIVNARVSAFLFCYLQINRGLSATDSTTPVLEQWLPEMNDIWMTFIQQAATQ